MEDEFDTAGDPERRKARGRLARASGGADDPVVLVEQEPREIGAVLPAHAGYNRAGSAHGRPPGARSRVAIGLVIAAGMSIGTLFTLFVTPAVYTFIARDHSHDRETQMRDQSEAGKLAGA